MASILVGIPQGIGVSDDRIMKLIEMPTRLNEIAMEPMKRQYKSVKLQGKSRNISKIVLKAHATPTTSTE